jgi:hypothetical protein
MNPGTTKDDSEKVPVQENFVHELTRRRVVQVALLYFAIAWTVTEVLSFLFSAIPVFPVWSKTLVAVLFVLGFPVAMFLAWRFGIGPDSMKRTEAAEGDTGLIGWYLPRTADFQTLLGHPRFEALVATVRSRAQADRQRIEILGDDLPPCVTNMRARIR